MSDFVSEYPWLILPPFFVALWLAVTTVLALLAGWFNLVRRFPDLPEEEKLRVRLPWASMGPGISMKGVLRLSVCQSGLRVGILRIFGPFSRDFLVPWSEITVTRKTTAFQRYATLQFGDPTTGSLRIPIRAADDLAQAAGKRWPERGPFPVEPQGSRLRRTVVGWAIGTACVAVFFVVVPMLVMPETNRPPIVLAVLIPAALFVVATVVACIQHLRE